MIALKRSLMPHTFERTHLWLTVSFGLPSGLPHGSSFQLEKRTHTPKFP